MSEAAKNTPNPVESSDTDPIETREWLDALDAVIQREGRERAHYLMEQLLDTARRQFGDMPFSATTAYVNTIPPALEVRSPGNHEYEERIRSFIRWNAMAMVVRANKHETPDGGSLGGHIASFASVATMIGAGMNHFWHAPHEGHGGDLIYFQGHSSPGLYSRAFIEGRLTEDQLNSFRQEVDGHGLPSYPHPKLMPDFWQFPTVSMGLGPLMAIYQARFLKYLHARGLADTANRKVWVFCGDGEMDEPESLGAIGLAARPRLLIADEPTSALDVSVQAVVLDLLRSLQAELGFACLFVSHDLAVVDSIAARTVVLSGGRVVESGPTEQVLARPREDYTRRLVMAVPVPDPVVQAARRERRRALQAEAAESAAPAA